MTSEEIDKIIEAAKEQLMEAFKNELAEHDLSDLLKFCFSQFNANFKTKKYRFDVFVHYEPILPKNQFWEDTEHGRHLVSIDKKTKEKSIIISNSYESLTVYESQRGFDPVDKVEVIQPIDSRKIKTTLGLELSFFQSLSRFISRTPKQELVPNESWKEIFGSK